MNLCSHESFLCSDIMNDSVEDEQKKNNSQQTLYSHQSNAINKMKSMSILVTGIGKCGSIHNLPNFSSQRIKICMESNLQLLEVQDEDNKLKTLKFNLLALEQFNFENSSSVIETKQPSYTMMNNDYNASRKSKRRK